MDEAGWWIHVRLLYYAPYVYLTVFSQYNSLKNRNPEAEEMAQRLLAHTVLVEDKNSVPSTHVWQLYCL